MSAPQLLALFDLVTIINLPERKDRLLQMQEQLRRIGVELSGSVELFPAMRPAKRSGFPTRGGHGCFLSHLGCIERALALGARSLLILEDDVDFAPDFLAMQASVATQLEIESWDFFYGGGFPMWLPARDTADPATASTLRLVAPDIPITCAHFIAIHGRRLQELHGYLAAMLKRPRGHPDGGPMDVDGAYSWFRMHTGAKTLIAQPELGHQRSSVSDIRPRWLDRLPVVRRLRALLSRAR